MNDATKKPPFFSMKAKQRMLITAVCLTLLAAGFFIAQPASAEVVAAPPAKVLTPPVVEIDETVSTTVGRSELIPRPDLVKHTSVTAVKKGIEDNYLDDPALVDFLMSLRQKYVCVLIAGNDDGVRLSALTWSAHRTGCVVVTFNEVIEEAPLEAPPVADISS